MATSRDDSVDIEDEDFEAFLNESLSDEEASAAPKSIAIVQESGEASSVWWEDKEDKESVDDSRNIRRRQSFMKTSSLVSEDFAAKRQADSFVTTTDSINEEHDVEQLPFSTTGQLFETTEITEEPETSVAMEDNPDASDNIFHSTLIGELQSDKDSEKMSDIPAEKEPEGSVLVPPSSAPGAQSNLLSQVQLSDTGSLDLTMQNAQKNISALSLVRKAGTVQVESSITELDEEVSESAATTAKRPTSEQSGSTSAVDKKAIFKAMSTLISDNVASSDMRFSKKEELGSDGPLSETTNSKTMPELIAEMEALDGKADERPQTPLTLSTDHTKSGSLHFTKSPYRPTSSQITARVRSTGRGNSIPLSPSGTLNQRSAASSRPMYSHVKSSGYGLPSYMPHLSRGSAMSYSSIGSRGGTVKFLDTKGSKMSDNFGSVSMSKENFGMASGDAYIKQNFADFAIQKHVSTQTIGDLESKKEAEHWRHLWTESCRKVNELHARLEESDHSLAVAQERCQQANESLSRLRKTYATAKAAGEEKGADALKKRALEELERMLSAYQRDNEAMRVKIKDLEMQNEHLAEAPPGEVAHLSGELAKCRAENEELRRNASSNVRQHEVQLKRLTDEVKRARSAEAESELRAAQLAEQLVVLERKHALLEADFESKREQPSSVNLKSTKTVVISQRQKRGSLAKHADKPSASEHRPLPDRTDDLDDAGHHRLVETERLQLRDEISALRKALSLAETEVEKLRELLEHRPSSPVFFSGGDRTRKLEAAVKELETLLRERHPSSVPAAVLEIAAAEAAANSERIRHLEDRCRRLELGLGGGRTRDEFAAKFDQAVQADLQPTESSHRTYSAAIFTDNDAAIRHSSAAADADDRVIILRRHISEQDVILARLRNEANEFRTARLADQAELVRLKGIVAMFEKKAASNNGGIGRQEEMIATLLREKAMSVKVESKLKSDLVDMSRRLEVYEQRVRELMNQVADARSAHTPERRLLDRLLDRLTELERRFSRREEVIRELRAAVVLGQPTAASGSGIDSSNRLAPQIDPVFLRAELDKLVGELHELRAKAAFDDKSQQIMMPMS